jgi:hypothetical protein
MIKLVSHEGISLRGRDSPSGKVWGSEEVGEVVAAITLLVLVLNGGITRYQALEPGTANGLLSEINRWNSLVLLAIEWVNNSAYLDVRGLQNSYFFDRHPQAEGPLLTPQ